MSSSCLRASRAAFCLIVPLAVAAGCVRAPAAAPAAPGAPAGAAAPSQRMVYVVTDTGAPGEIDRCLRDAEDAVVRVPADRHVVVICRTVPATTAAAPLRAPPSAPPGEQGGACLSGDTCWDSITCDRVTRRCEYELE